MTHRHAVHHNTCWYQVITKKAVRENPTQQFTAADIGRYLIREDVDLFEAGDIVSRAGIEQQLAVWQTGRLSSAYAS